MKKSLIHYNSNPFNITLKLTVCQFAPRCLFNPPHQVYLENIKIARDFYLKNIDQKTPTLSPTCWDVHFGKYMLGHTLRKNNASTGPYFRMTHLSRDPSRDKNFNYSDYTPKIDRNYSCNSLN